MRSFHYVPLVITILLLANHSFALPADLLEGTSSAISNGPLPSPDGTCGGQNAYTCTGTSYGPCCSSYNFCGNLTSHCLPSHGCQPKFGTCTTPSPTITPSLDGLCGTTTSTTCSGGPWEGSCCSSYGFCGFNSTFCLISQGCQSAFGKCTQISPFGTCGGNTNYICTDSAYGPCCSEAGYCGSTSAYCGLRCQGQAGLCLAPSEDGTCGWERGYTCLGSRFGACCSGSGWCGETMAHCSVKGGCQQGLLSNPHLGVCSEP
ncbi:carbohydrate-binding module family 18 protein [Cadophora sp. DSE1049]|nr:carbohydrate-binding module family 18 protein [Cadophora sp. DSE1049]